MMVLVVTGSCGSAEVTDGMNLIIVPYISGEGHSFPYQYIDLFLRPLV